MYHVIATAGTIAVIYLSAFLGWANGAQAAIHPSHPEYRKISVIQQEQRRLQSDSYRVKYLRNPYVSRTHALHPYHRQAYYNLRHYENDPYYQRNRLWYQDNLYSQTVRCYNESYRRDNYRYSPYNHSCKGTIVEPKQGSYGTPQYRRNYR